MVSFGFRNRVAVAVSANAGTYAMPDLATPWPFGLGETDIDTDALRALLGFPFTVMAGNTDLSTAGRFLPKGPRSIRQGTTPPRTDGLVAELLFLGGRYRDDMGGS
jgi:hypothetical protein